MYRNIFTIYLSAVRLNGCAARKKNVKHNINFPDLEVRGNTCILKCAVFIRTISKMILHCLIFLDCELI